MLCLLLVIYFTLTKISYGLSEKESIEQIPRIIEHPINMTVSRNDPVTLSCKSQGKEPLNYEWYRDGHKVMSAPEDPSSHRILLPDGSLFFLRAMSTKKEQDAGVYWCVVSNDIGFTRSKNATLEIAYLREDFRSIPRDTDAAVGDDIVLRCLAPKGYPIPVIRWKKDGEYLDLTSSNRVRIGDNGSLLITHVTKGDVGRYTCSAKNVAAIRDTRPIKLRIYEPPIFINRPISVSVLAGDDVLLPCQVSGDPYPDVQWRRSGKDIDILKVKIVKGKGLRLNNVHTSDEGEYICEATNHMGTISASSSLLVNSVPLISVPPQNFVRISSISTLTLNCIAIGSPSPLILWTIENSTFVLSTGSIYNGFKVSFDGSLSVMPPVKSGVITCIALNEVGSTMARSVIVVNNEVPSSKELNLIRLSLEEKHLENFMVTSSEAKSVRLVWNNIKNSTVDGFQLYYRDISSHTSLYHTRLLERHCSQYDLNDLEEYSVYDIFLQPYYKGISGLPSKLLKASTKSDFPSQAPTITEIKMLNISSIYIKWNQILQNHQNGKFLGYEIHIKSNDTTLDKNISVSPENSDIILLVTDLSFSLAYNISMSGVNEMGQGPFSSPITLLLSELSDNNSQNFHVKSLLSLFLLLFFTLLLLSIVSLFLFTKRHQNSKKESLHPLEHLGLQQPLWIDRQSFESESCEKKHLTSTSVSDNEYTYIDRKYLLSTFSRANTNECTLSTYRNDSLQAPYATTDIVLQHGRQKQIYASSRLYPLSVTPIIHNETLIQGQKITRDSKSCDDITSSSSEVMKQCYPHLYSRYSTERKPFQYSRYRVADFSFESPSNPTQLPIRLTNGKGNNIYEQLTSQKQLHNVMHFNYISQENKSDDEPFEKYVYKSSSSETSQ